MASLLSRGLEAVLESGATSYSPLDGPEFAYQKAASKEDYSQIDYTILSVVVMTLGLIIVVELIQHKLDHKAHGRLFFRTVLEAVYRELATLGIVEFFIFIIKKYYKDLNPGAKDVFADVHFMLFYAALFNAFQSVITAFFSTRVSHKLWVRTEQLELDHYIEIREEYERVDAILYGQRSDRERQDSALSWNTEASANFAGYSVRKLQKTIVQLGKFLRYPHLCRQHAELLVQVRFHELRVHFLKANDLPLQLKVSEYLERCELQVLCKLVHISPFAWLLLTFAISVIYFLMSIVVDVTDGDVGATGDALTAIFLGSMVLFVIGSIVIFYKMTWIFGRIMRMKLWHGEQAEFRTGKQSQRAEKEIANQRALFWGKDPKYIAVMLQFMQFGFANALAVILVFSDDINVSGAPLPIYSYVLIVLSCYAAFVYMTGQVIPRYTLCTCLGQMVNEKRLMETLAEFHLAEVQRKRKMRADEEFAVTTVAWEDGRSDEEMEETVAAKDSTGTSTRSLQLLGRSSLSTRSLVPLGGSKTFEDLDVAIETETESPATLAELVETDTKQLRTNLEEREKKMQMRIQDRKSMRRVMSEGVSSMRLVSDVSDDGSTEPKSSVVKDRAVQWSSDIEEGETRGKRAERRKSSSADARMEQMQGRFFVSDEQETSLDAASLAELGMQPKVEAGVPINGEESDDQSDVDDVPAAKKHHHYDEHDLEPLPSLQDMLRNYFLSRRYHIISAVFGTMCCFYVVGHRMEALLLATGVLENRKNTWGFPLNVGFWIEVAYLACFHVAALIVMFLFRCGKATTRAQRALVASAIIDVVICSTCLIVLFLAESERCCDGAVQDTTQGDCCEPFSSRSWGGIGTIEPFTSLVALRVLRYPLAEMILSFLNGCMGWDKSEGSSEQKNGAALHPLDPLYDKKGHRDAHLKHSFDAKGSIVELWKQAIGKYHDVVEEYGEFSGELLQAMLGVEILSSESGSPREKSTDDESDDLTFPATEGKTAVSEPPLIQSKVGLSPVKEVAESSPRYLRRTRVPGPLPLFDRPSTANSSSTDISFVAPNARLIRSMRRGDRKLLPLLDQWMTVDVVMTKFEIVYFAVDDDEKEPSTESKAIQQALTATHGGKGLRLRDVAIGRQVVGHLAISTIDSAHVERVLPHDERHLDQTLDQEGDPMTAQNEYWRSGGEKTMHARSSCWQRLKEDRLKIHSNSGTLYLRFYSDLDDAIEHEDRLLDEKEAEGALFKNNALQWCQTLVRLCRTDQLHQKLPHYGQGDSDELRDFIEIVDPNESHAGHLQAQLGKLRHSVTHSVTRKALVERFQMYRRRSSLELNDDASDSSEGMFGGREPEIWA